MKKFQSGTRICSLLLRIGRILICATGGLIFLFLCWYSFRYTQYMPPESPEFPLEHRDPVIWNLLTLVIFGSIMSVLMSLGKKLSAKTQRRVLCCLIVFMVFLTAFFSFQWILSADRMPAADQFYCCCAANSFIQGVYTVLEKGYYLEIYPQQLGLIALLELIFSIAGPNNYFAFEVLSALLVPCIAFLGYRIVREITDDFAVSACYCLLMTGCLPLIFYTSFVYGEISSLFFSLLGTFFALRYRNRHRIFYLLGVVLSFAVAFLVRKNSIIIMIAFCLTALLWSFKNKDKKMFITALLAMILPFLTFWGVQQMYEVRSGIKKSSGEPFSATIVIGLEEFEGRFGWHYGTRDTDIYAGCGYDIKATDEVCKQIIGDRLQYFISHPAYAVHFFKQKQLSQWNEPLYQAYHFSQNYSEDTKPKEGSFLFWLKEHFFLLLGFCDKLQLILYLGMLLYYVFAVRKDSDMLQHILPVMIIGGFLFSVIWEAKARYILPYYVAMFPMAGIGYQQFFLTMIEVRKKWRISKSNGEYTPENH